MTFADMCFPKGNEEEFLRMAVQLKTPSVIFCYDRIPKNLQNSGKNMGVEVFFCSTKKHGKGLYLSLDPADVRLSLEKERPDFLAGLEFSHQKDFMHHRNSGLNQVMTQIAKKRKTTVCFDFGRLLQKGVNQAVVLGRMVQNAHICKKGKVDIGIASFARTPFQMRSSHDLASLFLESGVDSDMVKKGLAVLHEQAVLACDENVIGEGIRVIQDD